MSSLRLTTQLQQRIEMLQMTSMELNELIEQELVANPVLEEVLPGDEVQEISNNILDQNADGNDPSYLNGHDADAQAVTDAGRDTDSNTESRLAETAAENGLDEGIASDSEFGEDASGEASDAFDEIDYGREFQDYLDPGYRTQEIEYKDDAPSFEQFLTHAPSLSEHLEWQLNLLSLDENAHDAALMVIGNLDDDGRLTSSVEEISLACGVSLQAVERGRQ